MRVSTHACSDWLHLRIMFCLQYGFAEEVTTQSRSDFTDRSWNSLGTACACKVAGLGQTMFINTSRFDNESVWCPTVLNRSFEIQASIQLPRDKRQGWPTVLPKSYTINCARSLMWGTVRARCRKVLWPRHFLFRLNHVESFLVLGRAPSQVISTDQKLKLVVFMTRGENPVIPAGTYCDPNPSQSISVDSFVFLIFLHNKQY